MGALLALVGRLVDTTANMVQLSVTVSGQDRERMRRLAQRIAEVASP